MGGPVAENGGEEGAAGLAGLVGSREAPAVGVLLPE